MSHGGCLGTEHSRQRKPPGQNGGMCLVCLRTQEEVNVAGAVSDGELSGRREQRSGRCETEPLEGFEKTANQN